MVSGQYEYTKLPIMSTRVREGLLRKRSEDCLVISDGRNRKRAVNLSCSRWVCLSGQLWPHTVLSYNWTETNGGACPRWWRVFLRFFPGFFNSVGFYNVRQKFEALFVRSSCRGPHTQLRQQTPRIWLKIVAEDLGFGAYCLKLRPCLSII